jgi:hypothetical protein
LSETVFITRSWPRRLRASNEQGAARPAAGDTTQGLSQTSPMESPGAGAKADLLGRERK